MALIGNPIISTDFPVDYFSGNGSTTAFTLSIAPASVNSLSVQVSGVVQSPQTYTVSGTTLTFSAAPPTGSSNIVVRHLGIAGIPNTPSAGSVVTSSFASGAITSGLLPTGSVIQVVSSTKTDTASTSSTSFSDITGLSVSITPRSSTNKIMVFVTLGGIGNTTNAVRFSLFRNSTAIAQPDSGTFSSTLNIYPGGGTGIWNSGINWLDTPSTTSATTYKLQWCVDGSTGYLNRHTSNVNYNSVSSITVMEIAA